MPLEKERVFADEVVLKRELPDQCRHCFATTLKMMLGDFEVFRLPWPPRSPDTILVSSSSGVGFTKDCVYREHTDSA
ncbi:hypothetical protein AVEN_225986-1 [Araneus ventricosus]|uniref:Uncharacterized protein n=1 Tax=Araneus ventricosus TaxID=182803 RepID=A0A4Y2E7N8_ARAVE|nr:hypothetical protein AVEN_225986-1 [Araneus ventricosus]